MRKYFKIGEKAHVFICLSTGLKVSNHMPGFTDVKLSKKSQEAVGSGHIIEIKEAEYDELVNPQVKEDEPVKVTVESLKTMTKEDILAYLEDNFDVTDENRTSFADMDIKAIRKVATSWIEPTK